MKLSYYHTHTNILLLLCIFIPFTAVYAQPLFVSTSNGVYKVEGNDINTPIVQKFLPSGQQIDAFKTEQLAKGQLIIAWGMGRTNISQNHSLASLELVSGKNYRQRNEIITTKGKRLRDFIIDGENIIAVGHNNADIHLYSLITGKHTSTQVNIFNNGIIHAIESGDVDGDSKNEYYITVTSPNMSGGLGQAGRLIRLDVDWDNLAVKLTEVLDAYEEYASHIKEIGIADLNADQIDELIIEVAPQIEAYSPTDLNYTEPMRLLSLSSVKGKYLSKDLASAEIRLGRLLSFADIDKDGDTELFFVDYYGSGIYIMENNKQKRLARGDNVNTLANNWKLTRVDINALKASQKLPVLKSNSIIYLKATNRLLVVSDGYQLETKAGAIEQPMSLNYYKIITKKNRYQLSLDNRTTFKTAGSIWHVSTN